MRYEILCAMAIILPPAMSGGFADSGKTLTLTGWGIDTKNLDELIADAAAVGLGALITGSTDPVSLTGAVEAGVRNSIEILPQGKSNEGVSHFPRALQRLTPLFGGAPASPQQQMVRLSFGPHGAKVFRVYLPAK